jgi:hypothetical protein
VPGNADQALSPLRPPRFEKKLRVALGWTLNLFFPKDLAQHVTLHEVERVQRRLETARQRSVISTAHQVETSSHRETVSARVE